jgi:DNA-binding NarL/FixJ family response regulator
MVSENTIRLLVVDDHTMFREGLVRMLEKEPAFSVVGQAGTAAEALRALPAASPALVLLDVDLAARGAMAF